VEGPGEGNLRGLAFPRGDWRGRWGNATDIISVVAVRPNQCPIKLKGRRKAGPSAPLLPFPSVPTPEGDVEKFHDEITAGLGPEPQRG